MKRTEPQSVREVLENVLRQSDLETELKEHEAALNWARIVGPGIMARCGKVYVRKGVLTVPISSASVRQELSMMRTALMTTLNNSVGKEVIKDIRFVGM